MKTREDCLAALRQAMVSYHLIKEGDEFNENTRLAPLIKENFDDVSHQAETRLDLMAEEGPPLDLETVGTWIDWVMNH